MSNTRKPVIAIDGPAGAGKSTVAKRLAVELDLRYLDTGAMYRALAVKVRRSGLELSDGEKAAELIETTRIEFGEGDPQPVFLDGENVSDEIRTPEAGEWASSLSTHGDVRKALVVLQQAVVAGGGVVLEGRDATTVIAPQADLKVYMTASLEERAVRRKKDFDAKGLEVELESVREQIENRDHRDINRDESPLRWAPGAHRLETAGRTIDEVTAMIVELLKQIDMPG